MVASSSSPPPANDTDPVLVDEDTARWLDEHGLVEELDPCELVLDEAKPGLVRVGPLRLFAFLCVALVGCQWLQRVDPPAHRPPPTADCSGLGEERCSATACCDAWHDWRCNPWSGACEYQPEVPAWTPGTAPDGGRDAHD